MRPKFRPVLEEAIEVGTLLGYRKAFKHNDSPSENQIIEAIFNSIMLSIDERFEFTEDEC